jgi:hypothetical protein
MYYLNSEKKMKGIVKIIKNAFYLGLSQPNNGVTDSWQCEFKFAEKRLSKNCINLLYHYFYTDH